MYSWEIIHSLRPPAIREARGHLTAGKDRYLLSYGVTVTHRPLEAVLPVRIRIAQQGEIPML